MGVILVYDCTDERSFVDIRNWVKQIESNARPDIKKVLVATKCDMVDKKVESEVGKELANELNINFYETSSKLNKNVEEVFTNIVEQIVMKTKKASEELKHDKTVSLSNPTKSANHKCC